MNKLIALGERLLQLMHISIYATHSLIKPLVLAESQHTYIYYKIMPCYFLCRVLDAGFY